MILEFKLSGFHQQTRNGYIWLDNSFSILNDGQSTNFSGFASIRKVVFPSLS